MSAIKRKAGRGKAALARRRRALKKERASARHFRSVTIRLPERDAPRVGAANGRLDFEAAFGSMTASPNYKRDEQCNKDKYYEENSHYFGGGASEFRGRFGG
jgi:hypothetical protein